MNFEKLETELGERIIKITPISGGDINDAYKLETLTSAYFLKHNIVSFAVDMFNNEAKGLQLLSNSLRTPKVFNVGKEEGFLLLEYIEKGRKTPKFWKALGRDLAQLHQISESYFGLENSNYIGILPQSNVKHKTWKVFYINERLLPQVKMAIDSNRLKITAIKSIEKLCEQLEEICPIEPSSLIHGDLWSGNFLANQDENPIFIDPAIAFAHRELDIAMTHLFGGFDKLFYDSYQENFPLESNFENRGRDLPIVLFIGSCQSVWRKLF